jgi:hypothetical protein
MEGKKSTSELEQTMSPVWFVIPTHIKQNQQQMSE